MEGSTGKHAICAKERGSYPRRAFDRRRIERRTFAWMWPASRISMPDIRPSIRTHEENKKRI
jgi:hypothetical protein